MNRKAKIITSPESQSVSSFVLVLCACAFMSDRLFERLCFKVLSAVSFMLLWLGSALRLGPTMFFSL